MVDKKGKKEGTEREEKVHVNDIRHCAIEVEAKSLCVKEKTREARGVSMPSHDGFFTLCIYSIALFFNYDIDMKIFSLEAYYYYYLPES